MSYQKFGRDIGLVALVNILVALSGLILLPVLTKTLGAYDYGLWVQAQVTLGLVMNIVHLGVPIALSRFLAAEKDKNRIRTGFYSVFFFVLFNVFLVIFWLQFLRSYGK